jgi:peroxiredoxin
MQKAILAVAAGALIALAAPAGEPSGPAPQFTLQSRGGENVALSDFAGDVVMVNFWASWCAPCLQEMPHLEALHRRYQSLGFTLLGVNVEDNPRAAERWLAERPVSFEILYDRNNDISKLYGVIAMPTTVLIDRAGNQRFIHHGYLPGYEDQYQTQIRTLLRE